MVKKLCEKSKDKIIHNFGNPVKPILLGKRIL